MGQNLSTVIDSISTMFGSESSGTHTAPPPETTVPLKTIDDEIPGYDSSVPYPEGGARDPFMIFITVITILGVCACISIIVLLVLGMFKIGPFKPRERDDE
jgi:hypothetical protein